MHWYIPTLSVDVNEGGTFWTNACFGAGGRHTEDLKKVTCKACKALIEHPNAKQIAAALLRQKIVDTMDESPDFHVTVGCNACDYDADTSEFTYIHGYDSIAILCDLFDHVAYEHMGGADVRFSVSISTFTAYELNYAMGKAPMTQHESNWRERELDLDQEPEPRRLIDPSKFTIVRVDVVNE